MTPDFVTGTAGINRTALLCMTRLVFLFAAYMRPKSEFKLPSLLHLYGSGSFQPCGHCGEYVRIPT